MKLSTNLKKVDEIKSTSTAAKVNINILPEHVIDQIKAGEVLERPAALLKELIENSIDAKATEISIHIVDNGLSLLAIEDNGLGMDFENLPRAFLRHATSKLNKFEDLYFLNSYGFRGEALASLAASARVTCVSQPQDLTKAGGKLIIHGGKIELSIPQKTNQAGTAFFIKDLFYNTPARLKFIKSKTSERIQLKKILYAFILSHPDIQFQIKWDDKEKEFFKRFESNDFLKRINNIFPSQSTIYFATECYQQYRVRIFFTKDASRNSTHKHQFLFINSRYFQDKSLHQVLIRNAESIWPYGESGHYSIFIDAPSDSIDVNVHPNKTQIKFLESDIVSSLLVSAIKTALKPSQELKSQPLYLPSDFNTSSHHLSDFKNMPLNAFSSEKSPPELLPKMLNIVDNNFGIMFQDNEYFLLHLKNLTSLYLIDQISHCINNEEWISPLLVSEPFQAKKSALDKSFDQLKKLGFEFDRLGPETIILRTIPRNLPRAILHYSAQALMAFFTNHHSDYSPQKFKSYLLNEPSHNITFNEQLISNLMQMTAVEDKYCILKLNKDNLGLLFK